MNDHHLGARRRAYPRRFLAFSTALAVTAALGGIVPATAGANEVDGSKYLSAAHGDVLSVDLAGANVANAATSDANDVNHGPDQDSLNLSALQAVTIDLGGVKVPLIDTGSNNGILELGTGTGALSSYASSESATSSKASAGVLGDDGALALDSATTDDAAATTINATSLLKQALGTTVPDGVLDQAEIKVGALGATATKTGTDVERDYTLADLDLDLHSPLVAKVTEGLDTVITTALAPISELGKPGQVLDDTFDDLAEQLKTKIPLLELEGHQIELTDTSSLVGAVKDELLKEPVLSNDEGTVKVDLSTGTIQVDLAKILLKTDNATSLNDLPANTEVLDSDVVSAIVAGVTDALAGNSTNSLTTKLSRILTEKVYGLQLNISLDLAIDVSSALSDDLLNKLTEDTPEALKGLLNTGTDVAGEALNKGGEAADSVVNTGADAAKEGADAVNKIVDKGTETTDKVLDQGKDAVNQVTDPVNSVVAPITDPATKILADANKSVIETNQGPVELAQDTEPLALAIPVTINGTLGGFVGQTGYEAPKVTIDSSILEALQLDDETISGLTEPLNELFADWAVPQMKTGLADKVTSAITGLQPALSTAVKGVLDQLIGTNGALKPLLENLASIEVNDQPEEGDLGDGSFTVRALNVKLLPKVANSLVNIELGSATVKAADKEPTNADTYDPVYGELNAPVGTSTTGEAPKDSKGATFPDKTTFALSNSTNLTWLSIDKDSGKITANPPTGTAEGSNEVSVEVTYPDGTKDTVTAKVNVVAADADTVNVDPRYAPVTGTPGETAQVAAPTFVDGSGKTVEKPENAKFSTEADGVTINADTGALEVPVPANAISNITVPVTVTYADKTTDKVEATVTVGDQGGTQPGGDLKCSAAMDEIGKIIAWMIPVGLLTQLNLPGVDQLQAQLSEQFKAANTNLQKQFGIYNPELSAWVDSINAQLTSPEARRAIGGVALVIGGLKAAKLFIENCLTANGSSEELTPANSSELDIPTGSSEN